MTDFSTVQFVEHTHDHLNTYIAGADQKASILLTGQFAFLGLAATASSDILNNTGALFDVLAGGTAVVGVIAAVLAITVIYPRTPSPGNSVIYWGDIQQHANVEKYHKDIEELEDGDALAALVKQNYKLAEVAESKYSLLRWSLRFTLAMIGLAAITVLVYLFL